MSQRRTVGSCFPRYPGGRMARVCRHCPALVNQHDTDRPLLCPACRHPTVLTVIYNNPVKVWYPDQGPGPTRR